MTHVAPIRVAALRVLELDLDMYKSLDVPNAACLMVDRAEIYRVPGLVPVRSELGLTSGPVGAEP
jgi:hypothetical protein